MKKFVIIASMIVANIACCCVSAQDIQLPAPEKNQSSMTVVEALNTRHSVREFTKEPLTIQQLSNLCWAACGQTRDDQYITAPSAMNFQEIKLLVFNCDGVYEYLPRENVLKHLAKGDYRKLVAGPQEFVMAAPVSLVMVIDYDRMGGKNEGATMMGCVDAGNVSENVNLYCQAVGLATVPRATMDTDGIKQLLGYGENLHPIMNNPVGFAK